MINYKKITTVTLLAALLISAPISAIAADTKSNKSSVTDITTIDVLENKIKTIDVFLWEKTKKDISKNEYWVYTINSKYNPALGCINLNATSLLTQTSESPQDGYLCNQSNLTAISNDSDPTNNYKAMLSTRDAISASRKTKYVSKEFNIKVKIDNFSTSLAICNINECFFYAIPSEFERTKKLLNGRDGNIFIELPKFKNPSNIKDPNISDSKFIFSKFNDGQKDLPNFISEIDTIKYLSAYNTTLSEVKPRLSPLFMPNFYLSQAPIRANKIEICTIYQYCFTTYIEESITKYIEEKNPEKTFALNITNTNLVNYKTVGIIKENPNFITNNFDKTLTLTYETKNAEYFNINRIRIGNSDNLSQANNKISKDYLRPQICDDAQCVTPELLPSTACPNNPEICFSAKFTPIKKYNIMYAKLIDSNGTPVPYAAIQFPSNSSAMINRIVKTYYSKKFMDEVYPKLPRYNKLETYYADENGIITFTLDLDHFYNAPQRCNMDYCSTDYGSIFSKKTFISATKENPLLITVPQKKFNEFNEPRDVVPTTLKPGMKVEGQILTTVNTSSNNTKPSDNPVKYLSPGAYLQTFDAKGNLTTKSETSATGKFSLTLPTSFIRMEVCSAKNQCHTETNLNKYYYISTDEIEASNLPLFTFPTPKDKVGMLRGLLYNGETKKLIANRKVYLFNDQNKLVGTTPTNAKGEFTKNLNYILYNKVTRIQGCLKFNQCPYNEIRLDEVQTYIDEQINYPFQILPSTFDMFMSIALWYMKANMFVLSIAAFVLP